MKKLLALVLALVMVLPVFALAETTVEELNWDSVADSDLVQEGTFVGLEDYGLMIWIPNGMVQAELEGYACIFATEDLSHGVFVTDEAIPEGIDDLDTLMSFMANVADDGEVTISVLNGIPCLTLTMNDKNQACVCFLTDTNVVTFNFAPMTDEEFAPYAQIMAASIQPME